MTAETRQYLVILGFLAADKHSLALERGNVGITITESPDGDRVHYAIGNCNSSTWRVQSDKALVEELRGADQNFFGYPGYTPIFPAQPEPPIQLTQEQLQAMPLAELKHYRARAMWYATRSSELTPYDAMWDAAILEHKRRRGAGLLA